MIAGDVFDHPDVTAPPIATFSRAVHRLRQRLPDVVVAVAAGVRDTPLDPSRQGPLAVVGALESVEAATVSVRRLALLNGELSVTLVPHHAARQARPPKLEPDPGAKWNVLVLHGTPVAADPGASRRKPRRTRTSPSPRARPALPVPLDGWDYVALGSRHTRARIAERAHYSGSLERNRPRSLGGGCRGQGVPYLASGFWRGALRAGGSPRGGESRARWRRRRGVPPRPRGAWVRHSPECPAASTASCCACRYGVSVPTAWPRSIGRCWRGSATGSRNSASTPCPVRARLAR